MQKFIILQWGKNASIIQEVTSGKFELYMVGNHELMNMDERGNIL